MILTSADRVLLHLHGLWTAKEPGREATQSGIAAGAHVLRSHVPRTLKPLLEEALVDERETRLPGRTRKTVVYMLTPAGLARARGLLDTVDAQRAIVDGRATSLGEARRVLGLTPVEAAAALRADGTLASLAPPAEERALLQRDDELAFLKRWRIGAAPIAVVYGAHGMGKTALGRAFTRTVADSAWVDLTGVKDLTDFAERLADVPGAKVDRTDDATSVAEGLARAFERGTKLLVVDSYGEVPEGVVDAFSGFLQLRARGPTAKLLVLAQETTPAYCRFYAHKDVAAGSVVERHLKGLDLEGTRTMLGNPAIRDEDLRRIYLLTKGCPLYLQFIREGDEYGLRENTRFTNAEIRLLLYSRGTPP